MLINMFTKFVQTDGLVEYSVQIPNSNQRSKSPNGPIGQKYSADIEWILAGKKKLIFIEL